MRIVSKNIYKKKTLIEPSFSPMANLIEFSIFNRSICWNAHLLSRYQEKHTFLIK